MTDYKPTGKAMQTQQTPQQQYLTPENAYWTRLYHALRDRRALIIDLAKRDAFAKYKSSSLGVLWAVLTPLVMLAIYTFVFGEVFQTKWPSRVVGAQAVVASKLEFASILFAGLIVFNFFADCMLKAPGLVVSNPNLVKKVAFPTEFLAITSVLGGLFQALVGFAVLLVFQLLAFGTLSATAWLLPIVWSPLIVLSLGLSWVLSALGVFLRDIGHTVGLVVMAMMFISPLFFPGSSFPTQWKSLVAINPLFAPIEATRAVLVFGTYPDWTELGINMVISILIAFFGFEWFSRSKRAFADVL